MTAFVLHPRLASDKMFVADWALSRVLLMDDARFPWLVLVPQRPDLVEVHDLSTAEQSIFIAEISRASTAIKTLSRCEKINIGALGNLVPQLHVHVVARKQGDAAWPGPVWGHGRLEPYSPDSRDAWLRKVTAALGA